MSPFFKHLAFLASILACCSLFAMALHVPASPKKKVTPLQAIYVTKRDHQWNRVHDALFVRTGPDGRSYGADRLEPLLWNDSKHLLDGKSADRVAVKLEEFIREKSVLLIDDPLKRAILQRDLWLVFNWLAGKPNTAPRKRLSVLLAKVIRQLALKPAQIAKLPDNYAAAVASKKYADKFDPENPERSYLPPNLFKSDGPWVCVGKTDGPTAPFHLREGGTNKFTNSAFLVFLKLPGGRDKTLEFLKQLAAFDQPLLLPNSNGKTRRSYPLLPNRNMPQWPKGTEVALVRRAMLIDASRKPVVSPLTESVQLRVMWTDTPELTEGVLQKVSARQGTGGQAFFDFQLRRVDLFGNVAGGIRDVSGERDFKTGFNSHPWDDFERTPNTTQPFPQRAQPFVNNRASCVGCHSFPGVYGFNSIRGFAFGSMRNVRVEGRKLKPQTLAAMTVKKVERAALKWKMEQPGWTALKKLLP